MRVPDVHARSQEVRSSKRSRSQRPLFSAEAVRMEPEDKSQADKLKECSAVLKDLTGLGIPLDCPEVCTLRRHFNNYIKDGIPWEGTVDFRAYGRIAEVKLPRRADRAVEVLLRLPRAGKR
jgi:hypothetical protein